MLEKNVVADQHAWDEAFRDTDVDPNLVWVVDEEEEKDRDEEDNQTKTPCGTHISGGSVLERTTIDKGVHTPNPNPAGRTEDIPQSSEHTKAGKAGSSAPSQKGARDVINVQLPKDMPLTHSEAFVTFATLERQSKLR